MPDEKSFGEHTIKVGSHDARMRWGRHRLGMSEPTDHEELVQESSQLVTEKEVEPSLLPFNRRIQAKVIQVGESTDFVGQPLWQSDIEPNVRDKTEFYENRGSTHPIPRYQLTNQGQGLAVSSFLGMAEGIYNSLLGKPNRLNRPFDHSATTSVKYEDTLPLIAQGKPVISALSNGFNSFFIQDTVDKDVIEKFLKRSAPQHAFDINSLHNSGGYPTELYNAARATIAKQETGNLDGNKGHHLWGKDLNEGAAVIVANIVARELDSAKSGKASSRAWIEYPWKSDQAPGLVPYYGLLLGQLSYHLTSPVAEKLLPPNRKSSLFRSFSTTPGYKYGYELVSGKERQSMGSYLNQAEEVKAEPSNRFAEDLAHKIIELNRRESWSSAHPKLRELIQNTI